VNCQTFAGDIHVQEQFRTCYFHVNRKAKFVAARSVGHDVLNSLMPMRFRKIKTRLSIWQIFEFNTNIDVEKPRLIALGRIPRAALKVESLNVSLFVARKSVADFLKPKRLQLLAMKLTQRTFNRLVHN
jgi:hypothetical protein